MFAYVVKRLLSGMVVVVLVSMAVFALFWYGPSDPARPICNNQLGARCSPEKLAQFSKNLGYENPIASEYGKWAQGIFVGREDAVRLDPPRVPRTLPGILLPDQSTGFRRDEGEIACHPFGRDGRRVPLPRAGRPHWCRGRATTGQRRGQSLGLEFPVPLINSLLPVRAADVALPHRHLRDAADQRHRLLLTVQRGPREVVLRAVACLDRTRDFRLHFLHEVRPRVHGGDLERGLHPHRQVQGTTQTHGRLQARSAGRHGAES